MSPRGGAEGGAPTIERFLGDPTIWLSVWWAGLLVIVILGVVFAMRGEQKRRQAGSLADLALVHELRAQIKRLTEDTRRLRRERDELLGVLTKLGDLLERCSEASAKPPR